MKDKPYFSQTLLSASDSCDFKYFRQAFRLTHEIRTIIRRTSNILDGKRIYRNTKTGKIRLELKQRIHLVFTLMLSVTLAVAQSPDSDVITVPRVGLIGEYESQFAALARENPGILLEVCGNDMDIAYEKWTDMLVAMEDYAESINYDINGLKTYLYIFWNADGTFRHLAFFPKSNSRNIPIDELVAFFKGFTKEYHMQIRADEGYSHYGSASFPTHARPEYRARKD